MMQEKACSFTKQVPKSPHLYILKCHFSCLSLFAILPSVWEAACFLSLYCAGFLVYKLIKPSFSISVYSDLFWFLSWEITRNQSTGNNNSPREQHCPTWDHCLEAANFSYTDFTWEWTWSIRSHVPLNHMWLSFTNVHLGNWSPCRVKLAQPLPHIKK